MGFVFAEVLSMSGNLKEPPEWYNDEATLKKLLAIVLAALCVKVVFYLTEPRDDRILYQPSGAVIKRSPW